MAFCCSRMTELPFVLHSLCNSRSCTNFFFSPTFFFSSSMKPALPNVLLSCLRQKWPTQAIDRGFLWRTSTFWFELLRVRERGKERKSAVTKFKLYKSNNWNLVKKKEGKKFIIDTNLTWCFGPNFGFFLTENIIFC